MQTTGKTTLWRFLWSRTSWKCCFKPFSGPAFFSPTFWLLFSCLSFQNEGPEARHLLAGDREMGGLRGEPGPSVWNVGVLTHLLPHFQEPHPAATHYEHRSVRGTGEKETKMLLAPQDSVLVINLWTFSHQGWWFSTAKRRPWPALLRGWWARWLKRKRSDQTTGKECWNLCVRLAGNQHHAPASKTKENFVGPSQL